MLTPLSPGDRQQLREGFRQADFTEKAVRALMAADEFPSRHLRNLPRLRARVADPTAFNLLARWFILGTPGTDGEADGLLPPEFQALLVSSGLVARHKDCLLPQAAILPYRDLLVASDPLLKIEACEDPEVVIGLNATTWLLHGFAIRRPSRATLDLGAGCGFHALIAAGHSDQVVATDINPRATEFARFNAWLNGLENIECLTGDLFEPVAGRSFELILSNPPFFVRPGRHLLFCDNTLELDLFCRLLTKQAARYLDEGGFLQMVCEWVEVQGQTWQERLTEWFEGTGCDAWVIRGYTVAPDRYGEQRLRETTPYSAEGDAARYHEWKTYYEARRVVAVHGGILALRRRLGHNWFRFDELQAMPSCPFGESVLIAFETRDLLDSLATEDALLQLKPRLSPDARLNQQCRPGKAGWEQSVPELTLVGGLAFNVRLQPAVAEFVGRLDGTRTLHELVAELAAELPVDRRKVRQECLAAVKALMERGFVRT